MTDRADKAEAMLREVVEALPRWLEALHLDRNGWQAHDEMTATLAKIKEAKNG